MIDHITKLLEQIPPSVQLIAVSKTRSVSEVMEVYHKGIRHFGENKVQELIAKQPLLPSDIHWHLIGHLQTNKVKQIAPFVHLIQSVDSLKLLKEINAQAMKNNRVIDCLLQIYIAMEDTKYGLDYTEAEALLSSQEFKAMRNIRITGLMGIATFTDDHAVVKQEFQSLKHYFNKLKTDYFADQSYFKEISMGMSGDFAMAIELGSTMVRIGTAIFGERDYSK